MAGLSSIGIVFDFLFTSLYHVLYLLSMRACFSHTLYLSLEQGSIQFNYCIFLFDVWHPLLNLVVL